MKGTDVDEQDKEPEVYASGRGIEILTDGTVRAQHWSADYDNIVRLVQFMANERHDSASAIAEVVEKPWHWDDLFQEMLDYEAASDE